MPLLPISTTRTSTPLTNQRLLAQLNSDQLSIQKQYDQLATGRRVLRLSDDPAAANRALSLTRGISRADQLVRNANSTDGFYASADGALSRIDDALIQARATAVEGAQTVISEDERAALATSIRESIHSVFAAGNAMFRDHQLAGGFLNEGSAFSYDEREIVFNGRDAVGQTQIGAGAPTAINVTARETVGAFSTFLEGESLGAGLHRDTRLIDMRGGKGVGTGVIRISGGGEYTDVDLSNASTIGDVSDVISSLEIDGRAISLTVQDDSVRLFYADGLSGTLAVEDAIGSTLATDLSIDNPGGLQAPPLVGDRLAPRVTTNTRIEDLNFGAGIDLAGGIRIEQGDRVFDIDFDGAETLGDVLIAINRSGADIQADLNETEGRIRLQSLRSGVDYSIGEKRGGAARALGIRSATEETKLSDLGRGIGLQLNTDHPDLVIVRTDGVELDLNLEGMETVDDVISAIQNHPDNQDTFRVLVRLNDVGNGIQLEAPPGATPITVRQPQLSDAGTRLGLIPKGEQEGVGERVGSVNLLRGDDYAPRDAGGALDTLLRLEQAVLDGDLPEIERLQAKVDEDLDRASRTRGRVGVWSRNLQDLKAATETSIVQMRDALSTEIDADLATVISDLSQRQTALQASMQILGQTSQISVLNYL